MDYQAFLHQLESNALPQDAFTGKAHLYAAWAYRKLYPAPEAAARCAHTFMRLELSHGCLEHYHHTLTMAILSIIYSRMDAKPQLTHNWLDFLHACRDVVDNARNLVLKHYSESRLDDHAARTGFVKPDLKPLPTGCLSH